MKIKRIIFDLDNTLIPWKDSYLDALKSVCQDYNLNYDYRYLNDCIDNNYELKYHNYSIKNFQEYVKNELNLELSSDFIKLWLDRVGNMSDENPQVNEVLSYLNSKYELVVLTNWFKDGQEKRLKKANMRHFFKEIYGGDNIIKPYKEAYLAAVGPYKPEECLMVGDSYELDYKAAIDAGLQAIHLNQKEPLPGVKTIKNLQELKNIL